MSKTSDLTYLEAQRAALLAQFDGLAPEQRLMRINLQSRLAEIDDEMVALQAEGALDQRAKAALVFGGRPVIESGAIEATFGAEALQAFQRLVSVAAATREGRRLGTRGPIPDDESYRLFITGTFAGSFGFELEEVTAAPQKEAGVLRNAVDEAVRLLQATRMDDEAYADAVAKSNPRVLGALADFLGLMESRGATLRLLAEQRACSFDTPDTVVAAAERTRRTTINDAKEPVRGVLSGLLTNGRRFELRLDSTGEIISGRISDSVADPSSLTPYFGARCVAHMWIVTVERAGKEQRAYYLTGVEPLPEGDDNSRA